MTRGREGNESDGGILRRPPRRRRRRSEDIGLASDKELALLATEYLKRQRKHWPDLVKAGLLPEPTPAIIGHMVDDFKHRHRTGLVAVDAINAFC